MDEEIILSLIEQIKNGNESCLTKLRDYLKAFIYKLRPYGLTKEEAFDFSLIPLNEAALKFDSSFNTKFTTYFKYYLSNAFIVEIENKNAIKVPDRIKRIAPKIYEEINAYIEENEDEPSDEEIIDSLSLKGIEVSYEDINISRNLLQLKETIALDDEETNYGGHISSSNDDKSSILLEDVAKIAELTETEKEWFEYYCLNKRKEISMRDIAEFEHVSYNAVYKMFNTIRSKIKKKSKILSKSGFDYLAK